MAEEKLILLVEDSDDDALLTTSAFAKAGIPGRIQLVRDGEQAIAYLQGTGVYSNRAEFPLPDLILLDLRLPGTGGLDVLRWVRRHPQLASLRVVVLTGSQETCDVDAAYQSGANSYVAKPPDLDSAVQMAAALGNYWLFVSPGPKLHRPN
jgi:CheY-like chemotaxis protein